MNSLNHVAFIMDGNGRWANSINKPRTFGHQEGVKRIKDIIEAGLNKNIPNLSFFAFSTENWNRPKSEIQFLFKLFENNFNIKKLKENFPNVKFNWIGFENNLSKNFIDKIKEVESINVTEKKMDVNIFFNYSGKKDLEEAFLKAQKDNFKLGSLKNYLLTKNTPDVDLLVRTSGEKRISNFLLYEIAYSEIIFEKKYWPDYTKKIFFDNLKEYNNRDRKFGKI